MSVKQMSIVWELDLPPNLKYVLLCYADHADPDGDNIYPSLGRVAHMTGYSRDQIKRLTAAIVKDDLMQRVKAATPTTTARYKLTLEKAKRLGAFQSRRRGGIMHPQRAPARDRGAAEPSGVGTNDPPQVGAPMHPEPPLEPSVLQPSNTRSLRSRGDRPANDRFPNDVESGIESEAETDEHGPRARALVNQIYKAMKKRGYKLDSGDEFGYQIGRAKEMLKAMKPTPEELEALPAEFVRLYVIEGRKGTDSVESLNEMRRQLERSAALNGPSGGPSAAAFAEVNEKSPEELARLERENEESLAEWQRLIEGTVS